MPYAVTQIQEKRTQRRKIGEQIRSLLDGAKKEGRELTGEELEKKEKMFADAFALRAEIEDEERLSGLLADDHPANTRQAPAGDELPPEAQRETEAAKRASSAAEVRNSPEYRQLFRRFFGAPTKREADHYADQAYALVKRTLQVDNETQAGIFVPPLELVKEILADYDAETPMRGLARVIQVRKAKGLGIFKRITKASTWKRGAELGAPTADTALKYGMRELHPKPSVGEIVVSRDWLREAEMDPEGIVRAEMVRDGAEFEEAEFLTGSGGGNQSLGIYTAHADGISTARDVSTGNTTTAITLAGLRKVKAALRPGWWKSATWMFGRTGWEQIYGLDDGHGRPMFVESVRVGEPDRVLNIPLLLNEWNPDTFTTGKYVGMLGDFKRGYLIADSLDLELERFDDAYYARENKVGFIARKKFDGMPVLEEAFVRVKLA